LESRTWMGLIGRWKNLLDPLQQRQAWDFVPRVFARRCTTHPASTGSACRSFPAETWRQSSAVASACSSPSQPCFEQGWPADVTCRDCFGPAVVPCTICREPVRRISFRQGRHGTSTWLHCLRRSLSPMGASRFWNIPAGTYLKNTSGNFTSRRDMGYELYSVIVLRILMIICHCGFLAS